MIFAGLAVALVGAGLASFPEPFSIAHAAIVAGLALAALSLRTSSATSVPAQLRDRAGPAVGEPRDGLDSRLEELKDVAWELRDTETRYRDLLDSQEDVIARRDRGGRLTFVNSAFCRLFAVSAADVLGRDYRPVVLAEEARALSATDAPRRRYCQLVETSQGPRWIAFEEHRVPALAPGGPQAARDGGLDNPDYEVQCLGRDVTEQRAFEAELASARDQALAADRAKSRFLAAMSHEIRTPMNGILGMAELLMEGSLTAEQRTYTEAIDQSAKTLLLLIDEILDFSKIEAGKLVLATQPFALAACVQGTVELLAPAAHEKGLDLAWTLDLALPDLVRGDEARVRQILLNLIGNAIKFTDRGGILVTVERLETASGAVRVALSVEDTGIGLSAEAMDRLFAEFGQAETELSQRRGGTGLGLAISRRLARAMHGDIEVKSELGRGATFRVTLDLQPEAEAGPVAVTRDVQDAGTVLLALDRAIERHALAASLRAAGMSVEETRSGDGEGAIARGATTARPVQVLIVDAHCDPAAAARLLAQARTAAPGQQVRGLLLVDAPARANVASFRAVGFEAYLVRPVRPLSLLAHIGVLVAGETALSQPVQEDSPAAPARAPTLGCRVLLAEDNAVNALLARRMLEQTGCEVVHVPDGEQAVLAMQRSLDGDTPAFDIVLMDVHMPRLDGLAATTTIRRHAAEEPARLLRLPPIVALTANAFAEDRQRCLAAGLDDYLAKPFQKRELIALLERWDRRRQASAEPLAEAAA